MKTALILLALVSVSYADQGADSFVTGFANAVDRRLGGHPEDSKPRIAGHYDIRDNYGALEGCQFGTYGQCQRHRNAVESTGECVWVDPQ